MEAPRLPRCNVRECMDRARCIGPNATLQLYLMDIPRKGRTHELNKVSTSTGVCRVRSEVSKTISDG